MTDDISLFLSISFRGEAIWSAFIPSHEKFMTTPMSLSKAGYNHAKENKLSHKPILQN